MLAIGDYQVNASVVSVAGGKVTILKADARRIAVLFATQTAGGCTVWPLDTVSNTIGFLVAPTTPVIEFIWAKHGILPMGNWFGFANPGPVSLSIVEVLHLEKG